MYRTILFVIHVLGAIAGIGPTFAFGIIGKLAGDAGPAGVWLLEANEKIEKMLVLPVVLITQPLTGVLLIFETGRDTGFFKREWLVISIVLYAVILILSLTKANPGLAKMIRMAKAGEAGTPEFASLVQTQQKLGPLFGVMTLVIIVMMVWRPGDLSI